MEEQKELVMKVPGKVPSDYAEIIYLIVLFVLGAPLNLAAYTQMTQPRPIESYLRLRILKRHLNFSDLLVIMIFTPSKVCWLLTYEWHGGLFLCKLLKFLHTFSFQISSNLVACIALDRLFSVIWPPRSIPVGVRRVKRCLLVAWLLAICQSSPQLFLWTIFQPFPGNHWTQCCLVWTVEAWQNRTEAAILSKRKQTYLAAHLVSIFWLPLAVIALSYLIIYWWIIRNTPRNVENSVLICATSPSGTVRFQDQESPAKRVSFQMCTNSQCEQRPTIDNHGADGSAALSPKSCRIAAAYRW